jgi:hypothetical protein
VLEPPELALDGTATAVQLVRPLALAGIGGCNRSALTKRKTGAQSPVGQRHAEIRGVLTRGVTPPQIKG